jgi:hypothetical protein
MMTLRATLLGLVVVACVTALPLERASGKHGAKRTHAGFVGEELSLIYMAGDSMSLVGEGEGQVRLLFSTAWGTAISLLASSWPWDGPQLSTQRVLD